jgi:hypothetical protein
LRGPHARRLNEAPQFPEQAIGTRHRVGLCQLVWFGKPAVLFYPCSFSPFVTVGMSLVTGNTEDFQAIQRTGVGLRIENWRDP